MPRPVRSNYEVIDIAPKLLEKLGEAKTVKITLIGRPGRIVEKGEVVLTSMQQSDKARETTPLILYRNLMNRPPPTVGAAGLFDAEVTGAARTKANI